MGSGSEPGPPDDAAKLVPADALAYVGFSTDTGRGGVRGALALARRFPAFASLRDGLLRRLTAPGCGVAASGMHGRELAVAVLSTGSLVLVDTGSGSGEGPVRTCGKVRAQRLGRFLAVGSAGALDRARAVSEGRGAALAASA